MRLTVSPARMLTVARVRLLVLPILLLTVAAFGQARAAGMVNIDHLVSTDFSPMVVGQTAKRYTTEVTVRNDSMTEILSPIRVVITSIDRENTEVGNADGTSGGNPFIEIDLPGGVLAPGASTAPAVVEFIRRAGNSTPGSNGNGKNKKSNFPVFEFGSSVFGGAAVAPQAPTSSPNALEVGSGSVDVVFAIGVVGDGSPIGSITLRNLDGGGDTPTNDLGQEGDAVANDGIYSATLSIKTDALSPGQCLSYVGVTLDGNDEVVSAVYQLCATQFSTRVAVSNTEPGNLIELAGGGEAIADELLIQFARGTSEDKILQTVKSLNGTVVGTVLPVRLYQVRLPAVQSEAELNAIIAKLEKRAEVVDASPNGFGLISSEPDDTNFSLQHALETIRADDVWGDSMQPDPWDNGIAIGGGLTVVLLDLGVDAAHTDLVGQVVTPAPTVSVLVGDGNTDSDGHGTAMAGIIAASTDNATGIAGTASGVQVQSVKVATASGFSDAEMIQGYQNLASPGVTGTIVNASINRVSPAFSVPGLCEAINNAINSGTGKIVINSAGNQNDNGNRWPGRCNDANFDSLRPASDKIDNKARFIVVAGSDCTTPPCATDSKQADSNFGPFVDVAAPGNSVNSTELGNTYGTRSGTSPASALVAGAAALLKGCGVGLNNLEATLLAGTLVPAVPYPSEPGPGGSTIPAGTTPRIDVYEAFTSINTSPSGLATSNTAIDELASPTDTTTSPVAVGNLSATSTDACDRIAFSIVGGADAGSFIIDGGQLQFDTGVLLDAETQATFNVTVRATDFFGVSAPDLPIVVTLNDLNEPPTILPQVRNIDENEPNGTNLGAPIVASDPDAGATWTFAITGGNTGGAFAISPAGQITVANQAALDFEINPVFNLTVEVTDNGLLSDSATITVNLNDIVEPIPNPIIVFAGFVDYLDAFSNPFRRWEFDVTNSSAFPAEMFDISPAFPCLPNPTASRSLVIYYDAVTNTPLNTFCALGDPSQMNGTWFARPRPGGVGPANPPPPAGVYMKIVDQLTGLEYQSNTVTGLPNP